MNVLAGWNRRAVLLAVLPVWVGLVAASVLWWVWSVREPPGRPLAATYGRAGIALAASAVLGTAWTLLCRRLLGSSAQASLDEVLEAGDWVMRTALNRPSGLPIHSGGSRVAQDLETWLAALQEGIREQYAAQALETERDLNLAKDFQQAYLNRGYPQIPAVQLEGRLRLRFYHRYEPASALGGDFFDIVTLAQDCAGVFIADVMGHGTRSALITAIIRTLIDDLTPQGRNARHFLTEMNKQFYELLKMAPGPLFASAFYLVADTTARVGTFSTAGHPSPFFIRRSLGRITRLDVPMPRGAAFGLIPDESYTGDYCRLMDGDLFVLFTDGAYEAHNRQGDEFGIARMEKVLEDLMYHGAKDVVDGLLDAIRSFAGDEPLADDICVVAVDVTTKASD